MKFLFALVLFSNTAFSAAFDNTVVRIKPSHSHLCLNSMDKKLGSGVTIVQWSCSAQPTQLFLLSKNEDGFYSIKSTGSGLCFGVPYAWQGISGITLYQVGCALYERKSNEFSINAQGNGLYTISPARAPQTCLGVVNASKQMFAGVVQEPCEGKPSQLFELAAE